MGFLLRGFQGFDNALHDQFSLVPLSWRRLAAVMILCANSLPAHRGLGSGGFLSITNRDFFAVAAECITERYYNQYIIVVASMHRRVR